jgi:hypothetical protein
VLGGSAAFFVSTTAKMKRVALLTLCLLIAGVFAMPIDLKEHAENLKELLHLPQPISPQSFSWSNCGTVLLSFVLSHP